jgi:L-ribulokinase
MPKPLVIGVDFGTLSARAVLVDARNGRELASASADYANGVICERLGTAKLKTQSALQNPPTIFWHSNKLFPRS